MPKIALGCLALSALLLACGSADDAQPTATQTSERVERQATVSQQQQLQQEAVQAPPTRQSQQVEQTQQPTQATEQPQQIQQPEEQVEDEPQADQLPAQIVGLHKGVRSQANTLGDPDAPILIEHFGDFT